VLDGGVFDEEIHCQTMCCPAERAGETGLVRHFEEPPTVFREEPAVGPWVESIARYVYLVVGGA